MLLFVSLLFVSLLFSADGDHTRETGDNLEEEHPRNPKKVCRTVSSSQGQNLPTDSNSGHHLSKTNVTSEPGSYHWLIDYFKSNT